MKDAECVAFLQWALPQMQLRWAGYRKVRRTLCKRLARRLEQLGLADAALYREYLARHAEEWAALDGLCPITISRFYRDTAVFDCLAREVLPSLARNLLVSGGTSLRAWSVGCASGEEAYTLMLIWRLAVAAPPGVELRILGTDVGAEVLARGAQACYPAGSIKLLPAAWVTRAFVPRAKQFCLREEFRRDVGWLQQDVRRALPDRSFHLIACRNLAFTYFEPTLQLETLRRLLARLVPGGALVIGHRESLPAGDFGLHPWPGAERLGVFRREPTP